MSFVAKRNLFSSLGVALVAGGLACATTPAVQAQMGGGQTGGMQGGSMNRPSMPGNNTGPNGPMGQQNTMEATMEQNFMGRMRSNSMAETEFSKLALKNSSNDNVKKLAQRTILDNRRMDGAMTGSATTGDVPMNSGLSSQAHKAVKSMKKLTGTPFDQMYLSQMNGYINSDQKVLSDSSIAVNSPDMRALMAQMRTLTDNRQQQLRQVAQSENFKIE